MIVNRRVKEVALYWDTITCDLPGCYAEFELEKISGQIDNVPIAWNPDHSQLIITSRINPMLLRSAALEAGWHMTRAFGRLLDCCPNCWEKRLKTKEKDR